MDRYRTTFQKDDPPLIVGDDEFLGVDQYNAIENIQPGYVQEAVNIDFTTRDAGTRGGFVCLPELGTAPFQTSGTWVSRTSAADISWDAVAYGAGLFVAVADSSGSANCVMTSLDGSTWTLQSAVSGQWYGLAYGNGLFVAVGISPSGHVMTSPNGVTWTSRTVVTNTWRSVTYAEGLFVAVADNGSTSDCIMTSVDGITWTSRTAPNANNWMSVAHGNGTFVAVSNDGSANRAMYSADGITWTAGVTPNSPSEYAWSSVVFGRALFVAVSTDGAVMSSSDSGATWTDGTAAEANTWNSVTFGNNTFVAVASTGTNRIMISANGTSWVTGTAAAANSWTAVANGNNLYVAVASSGTGNRVMTSGEITNVYASGSYSDPNAPGSRWTMLVGTNRVGFYAFGQTSHTVAINSAYTVSEQSTVVQCNNLVYIFRGSSSVPLYWTGNWGDEFTAAPTPTPGPGFSIIPNSDQGTYYQNRLWVIDGKDTVAASDILDFTTYDDLAAAFNLNTGDSDYLIATYPFGDNSLLVFKNRSILLLQNVQGSLTDVTVTEVTRQVGISGINAVVSVGADVVYMSDRNINLITLTSTSNAVQHKTLPLSTAIRKIFNRVNWNYAYKVSMAYFENKLFVSLPLDNATSCNTVVVYNFITESWFGEWNFDPSLGVTIQGWTIGIYLGSQRLHCISEDGRIFVTNEGQNDISGTIVAEISTSLTTRAYAGDNNNRIGRRMWMDLGTNRPSFSVTAYVEGASQSQVVLTNQTYSRANTWIANDSTYTLTNANNDYNRAGRQDYATGPNSIQPGTGFQPEMLQEYRYPVIARLKGRLAWFKLTNTQGYCTLMSVGGESRSGDRGSYVQVL